MAIIPQKELAAEMIKKNDYMYERVGEPTWSLSTGIFSLDRALGGGIPAGTVSQIFGIEGSAKTTLAYHILGQALRQGKHCVLYPIEGYSQEYAEACGVDTKSPLLTIISADF